jgi:hypothetical protein
MTTTITLNQAIDRHGVDVLDHLDRQASIPVISRIGRQGDVLIAAKPRGKSATTPLPRDGFPAVRGEAGGNTHLLLGDGNVFYDPRAASAADLDLGVLTVADDSTAYLAHPEHGYLGIAPGTYSLRRQREQADELRMVAD